MREFEEKPSKDRLEALAKRSRHASEEDPFEASMGIYMFRREVLERLLLQNEDHFGDEAGPDTHFGYDVIPHALRDGLRIVAHHHPGYWRVRPPLDPSKHLDCGPLHLGEDPFTHAPL